MTGRARLPLALRCLLAATLALALCAGAASAAGNGRGQTVKLPRALPKTKSPAHGQTVSGKLKWRVAVRGARPKRVNFVIDGKLKARRARGKRRGTVTLNTRKLSNGRHTLTAIAYRRDGTRSGKSRVRIKVANTANGPGSVYFGASIGDQLTGTEAPWDMSAVSEFEAMANRKLSILHFYSPFANCSAQCWYVPFPTTLFERVRQHGAIPLFSWASQSTPSSPSEPDFQLSDVLAGTHDNHIRDFARDAKEWGHPFFLRFNFEMNGDWFPWSEQVNGNGPGQSAAAWRHVHDIFTSEGADNVSWVWCPNVDPGNNLQDLGSLYPGDGYVDWSCLDGYNWGENPTRPAGWKSFEQVFDSTYERVVDVAPNKPMMLAELGSTEYGGSKAAWLNDMLRMVPTYAKIRAMVYFERYADGMDWPVETSASAASAFASGIQNPAYTATSSYANLPPGPIQPPS